MFCVCCLIKSTLPDLFVVLILQLIQAPSSEKEKLQKEIFAFSKNVQFGFPYKPSDMDWDPMLRCCLNKKSIKSGKGK